MVRVRDYLMLSVDGSGAAIASAMELFVDVGFGRCEGRLVLDWMCLREFSSDFHEN